VIVLRQIMNEHLNTAVDQIEIVQLIDRFGFAIDLRDWEKFQSVFHSSVEFDYSSIQGPAGNLTPEQIVADARRDLGGFQVTQHVITNHQITLSGNSATCQAHVRATHFLPNDRGDSSLETGGWYDAGLIRSDAAWKIQRWKYSVLWSRGNGDLFRLAKQSH
jgi:SnoaL-like domain